MHDGCDVTFSHTGAAYITTPSHGQIRLRLADGLLYLDYLVPQNKNVSPLRPLPTVVFEAASAMQGREYFLDLCAGACTFLIYQLRRNPHAQCLAVDWLSEHCVRRMVPRELRHRFHYVRMGVRELTPAQLVQLTQEQWGIAPRSLSHIHFSPSCKTLSRAPHHPGKTLHYVSNTPVSPEAKRDHVSLTRVLQTFHDSHFDPRRTLITVENPLGKFKDLDPV
jgi:hypothetical protein